MGGKSKTMTIKVRVCEDEHPELYADLARMKIGYRAERLRTHGGRSLLLETIGIAGIEAGGGSGVVLGRLPNGEAEGNGGSLHKEPEGAIFVERATRMGTRIDF